MHAADTAHSKQSIALKLELGDFENLDLSPIKRKLQDSEEGQGWTPETCDEIEVEYKRFLGLKRAYPDFEIVPNRRVDLFWHQHILDTRKYASDCTLLFGYFLHHYPYFGMNGEADYLRLCKAFEQTQALYEQHFGEVPELNATRMSRCRTACKPVKCK